MSKPKKLVRSRAVRFVKPGEIEMITDRNELNKLFYLKVKEELEEIKNSNFDDIVEFADLLEVVVQFAHINGFRKASLYITAERKADLKGIFNGSVLNNLNPENPSNALYFQEYEKNR